MKAARNAGIVDFGKFQKWNEAQSMRNSWQVRDFGHQLGTVELPEDDACPSAESSDEDEKVQKVTRSPNSWTTSSRRMLAKNPNLGPRHEGPKELRTCSE